MFDFELELLGMRHPVSERQNEPLAKMTAKAKILANRLTPVLAIDEGASSSALVAVDVTADPDLEFTNEDVALAMRFGRKEGKKEGITEGRKLAEGEFAIYLAERKSTKAESKKTESIKAARVDKKRAEQESTKRAEQESTYPKLYRARADVSPAELYRKKVRNALSRVESILSECEDRSALSQVEAILSQPSSSSSSPDPDEQIHICYQLAKGAPDKNAIFCLYHNKRQKTEAATPSFTELRDKFKAVTGRSVSYPIGN
jgi:hypothetical protein